nr:hypothetical protein [Micromonospora sp. DSM 115978]
WQGHEAGLLSVDRAAVLYARLVNQAVHPVARVEVAVPVAVPMARVGQGQPGRRTVASVL